VPDPLASFLNGRIVVTVGDITRERVDAIVNAANRSLLGGGGVDGAIHAAGGPEILKACQELRRTQYPDGLPTGEAVITTGGRLPARWVIHTVGPVHGAHGGREAELLTTCYRNSLAVAVAHDVKTLAFPAISTGVYGYPKDEAAEVASTAIAQVLGADATVEQVRLVFFSRGDAEIFRRRQRFGTG
jgi:O-acetyl-ADP-ribose deacetylase (regulator of RNase III)